jgi:hypothetical protein
MGVVQAAYAQIAMRLTAIFAASIALAPSYVV